MNNIKELFVSQELAIELKAKGFNEPCIMFYDFENELTTFEQDLNEKITLYRSSETRLDFILAPLYEQVINWFDKQYNIQIFLCRDDDGYFSCKIKKWCDDLQDIYGYVTVYDWNISRDKSESLEVVIKESLKLI